MADYLDNKTNELYQRHEDKAEQEKDAGFFKGLYNKGKKAILYTGALALLGGCSSMPNIEIFTLDVYTNPKSNITIEAGPAVALLGICALQDDDNGHHDNHEGEGGRDPRQGGDDIR